MSLTKSEWVDAAVVAGAAAVACYFVRSSRREATAIPGKAAAATAAPPPTPSIDNLSTSPNLARHQDSNAAAVPDADAITQNQDAPTIPDHTHSLNHCRSPNQLRHHHQPPPEHHAVVLFYKYTHIEDVPAVIAEQEALCSAFGLRGRLLISSEGVNGTLSAPVPSPTSATAAAASSGGSGAGGGLCQYIEIMKKDARFADVDWKQSTSTVTPFPDMMVKHVKELV